MPFQITSYPQFKTKCLSRTNTECRFSSPYAWLLRPLLPYLMHLLRKRCSICNCGISSIVCKSHWQNAISGRKSSGRSAWTHCVWYGVQYIFPKNFLSGLMINIQSFRVEVPLSFLYLLVLCVFCNKNLVFYGKKKRWGIGFHVIRTQIEYLLFNLRITSFSLELDIWDTLHIRSDTPGNIIEVLQILLKKCLWQFSVIGLIY